MKIWWWYLKPLWRNLNLILESSTFLPTRGGIEIRKCSNLNFSKVVWDIITKFSPVVNCNRNPIWRKFEGSRCTQKWISCQKPLKLHRGMVGLFFELHPQNFVRIHTLVSCKSAEIFIRISQVVSDSIWVSGPYL